MKQFTIDARSKGWTLVDLAQRWGLTTRQLARIATEPKQVQIDALAGLPDRATGTDKCLGCRGGSITHTCK